MIKKKKENQASCKGGLEMQPSPILVSVIQDPVTTVPPW